MYIKQSLDKRVNAESAKMKKHIDDKVEDLRKKFEAASDISEKLAHLTTLVNKNAAVSSNEDDTMKYKIVIRKLQRVCR